jgi:hypothetical protein
LRGEPSSSIICYNDKDNIEKAEEYLRGHKLDEAAVFLRKAVEDTLRCFHKRTENSVQDPGKFVPLKEQLKKARNRLLERFPPHLYKEVIQKTPEEHRTFLIPENVDDLDADSALSVEERDALKSNREKLRALLNHEYWSAMDNAKLIDDVIDMAERVLNPGAHAGETPLYEEEVQKALAAIAKLEQILPTSG